MAATAPASLHTADRPPANRTHGLASAQVTHAGPRYRLAVLSAAAKLTLLDGLRGLRTFYERPKAWSDTFRPIDVLTSDDEHNGERHELASDFVRRKGPSLDRPDGGEVDFTRRRPRPGARLA